ncbi:hypothetical protein NEDG_01414 [Nematocida displodere]|uniref:Phosphatidic acid phosphatase type 2/haloperoxidase domain-containing protein n=1 Tax=Nematocida displodere TaxID=1805483 RepID=A0A177ECU0_9MICR|nr:hypothetical protein NEDG_01414 [Nematocida displodere]
MLRRLTAALFTLSLSAISLFMRDVKPLGYFTIKSIMGGGAYATKEYVTFPALLWVCLLGSPVIIVGLGLIEKRKKQLLDRLLLFYLATALAHAVVDVLKFVVSKERPDYLDRCGRFKSGHKFDDGKRSFPSGHSALGAGTAVFLGCASFSALKRAGSLVKRSLVIYVGIIIPCLLAVFVCVSRVLDNRHDVVDVSAGALLGAVVSSGVYIKGGKGLRGFGQV